MERFALSSDPVCERCAYRCSLAFHWENVGCMCEPYDRAVLHRSGVVKLRQRIGRRGKSCCGSVVGPKSISNVPRRSTLAIGSAGGLADSSAGNGRLAAASFTCDLLSKALTCTSISHPAKNQSHGPVRRPIHPLLYVSKLQADNLQRIWQRTRHHREAPMEATQSTSIPQDPSTASPRLL